MTKVSQLVARLRGPDFVLAQRLRELRESGQVEWGAGSYGLPQVETFAHDDTRLIVGKYCSIATGVRFILGGNHPMDRAVTYPLHIKLEIDGAGDTGFPSSGGDIIVGNDVWLGSGSLILSGVRIGDGAVVAAGAVVVGDIPPFAIVGGVPAKVIKYRFDEETMEALSRLQWWNLPEEQIRMSADILSCTVNSVGLNELAKLREQL